MLGISFNLVTSEATKMNCIVGESRQNQLQTKLDQRESKQIISQNVSKIKHVNLLKAVARALRLSLRCMQFLGDLCLYVSLPIPFK